MGRGKSFERFVNILEYPNGIMRMTTLFYYV